MKKSIFYAWLLASSFLSAAHEETKDQYIRRLLMETKQHGDALRKTPAAIAYIAACNKLKEKQQKQLPTQKN